MMFMCMALAIAVSNLEGRSHALTNVPLLAHARVTLDSTTRRRPWLKPHRGR